MRKIFVQSWKGQERLYKLFWVYGFGINLVFFIIGVVAGILQAPLILLPFVPLYVAFIVWLLVAMWRCAHNVSWTGWTYVARAWVLLASTGFVIKIFQITSMIMERL